MTFRLRDELDRRDVTAYLAAFGRQAQAMSGAGICVTNGAEVFENSEGDYVVNRQALLQSFASVMVMCGLVIYHWEIGAKQTARDYGQSDHGVVVTAGEPEDRTFTINGAITPIAAGVSAVGKPFPAVGEGMGCARLPHTELGLPVGGPAGSIVCPCVWP